MSDSGNNWLQAPRGLGSCLTLTQSCHLERFDLVEVDIYAAQIFYLLHEKGPRSLTSCSPRLEQAS